MIVVSDTTAITTLLKSGMEGMLFQAFENIKVPQAVWDELLAFHSQLPGFVTVHPMARANGPLPETATLGRGEAEAITLAKEINADLLLTDDLKARSVAAVLNIRCNGLLGLLIRGKQRGQVTSVRESIERLEAQGGLYLSDAVKAEALKLASESK